MPITGRLIFQIIGVSYGQCSDTCEQKHVPCTSITAAHGFAEESRLRGRKSGALISEMVNHFAHEYIGYFFYTQSRVRESDAGAARGLCGGQGEIGYETFTYSRLAFRQAFGREKQA